MKKILFITVLFTSTITQAQKELKFDIFDALVFKTIEVSFENYLNEESSVGISAFFNTEKKSADFRYNEDRMITPYFRHYFSNYNNWNVFGEAFFSLNFGEEEVQMDGSSIYNENYTDGALGIAIGTKYVSPRGFVVDAYGGLGRNLFDDYSPSIVPRIGVNIGFRF